LGILGPLTSWAQAKTTTTLTILLFNSSKASPAILDRTKQRIDDIFNKSGIGLAWTDCPAPPGTAGPPICRSESAPGEIRVRIVDRQLKSYLSDNAFGFAISPIWATVYYESALRLARSFTNLDSNISVILSCLIAHEIGHLLLGQKSHAVDGIMRARWEAGQIQQAMKGSLRFLPTQEKVMLRNAQARTRPLGTSGSEQSARMMAEQRQTD
jgi:hypothetical protein